LDATFDGLAIAPGTSCPPTAGGHVDLLSLLANMLRVHVAVDSPLPPERVLEAAREFCDRRADAQAT
jgi:hypothetical protein